MNGYELSSEQLADALYAMEGWAVEEGRLHKEFRFSSFASAIGWMVSVAIHADRIDHHPEWSNVYNRVTVDLVTHDLGNVISNLDLHLAETMDGLVP